MPGTGDDGSAGDAADPMSARCAWEQVSRDIAREEGVPPGLFAAIIERESRFDPDARGGIAQIDQSVHDVGPHPFEHLRYAARMLAHYRESLGRYDLAVAAYNAGITEVTATGAVPASARTYVAAVMARGWEPSPCALRDGGDPVVAAALVVAAVARRGWA